MGFNFGAKSLQVKNKADTVIGDNKDGSIEAKKSFLPQAGVLFRTDDPELFGSVARNLRAHSNSGTSGPFSQSAAVLAETKDDLKPETSTNFELGWRYTTPRAVHLADRLPRGFQEPSSWAFRRAWASWDSPRYSPTSAM